MSRSWTSLESRRALNFARRGSRLVYRPGVVLRYAGRSVTMARPRVPYAISVDGRSRGILHETRAVFVVWFAGRPAGTLVVLWCGGSLVGAELTGDGTRGVRWCLVCPARRETLERVRR